jgi:hypothetical protein
MRRSARRVPVKRGATRAVAVLASVVIVILA